jgi:hypothetical protein
MSSAVRLGSDPLLFHGATDLDPEGENTTLSKYSHISSSCSLTTMFWEVFPDSPQLDNA